LVFFPHGESEFALQLLNNKYSISSIEDIMENLEITGEYGMMTTLERFRIYNETKLDKKMKDDFAVKPKAISEVMIQINTARRHMQE